MKIKSIEKLQDLLAQDIAWRKKELIEIRLLIHASQNPAFCRMGIAMLSAHFEGFVRQAANYYIIHVASQNIKISKLYTNFVAIHSKKLFEPCMSSDKITVYQKSMEDFLDNYTRCTFRVKYSPEKPVIKTESNPSSSVVKNIFDSIGLDFSPYETKKNYIDTDLLKNRHSIVHGERTYVDVSDFDNTFTIILEIMEQLFEQIIIIAIDRGYLRCKQTCSKAP